MGWSPYGPQGFESAKVWPLVVPYALGRGLDMGCGIQKCLPHMIGVDSGKDGSRADIKAEADDLEMFADGSLDFIFSSHLLEHIEGEKVADVLAYWRTKLKDGGHLILYVPNSNEYPKVGEDGSNPDHKWDIYPGEIFKLLSIYNEGNDQGGWVQVECEERSGPNEYSLFEVYRKTDEIGVREDLWMRNPDGRKRALVMRYGAIGDVIVAASVLPGLKEEGYHVTFQTNPLGHELLEHDPNIDEFMVYTADMIADHLLMDFWHSWGKRYDKIVNLNWSLEGACLAHDITVQWQWSHEARRDYYGDRNYLETAHEIAGVTWNFGQRFYPTDDEAKWARDGIANAGCPVVLWQAIGSSVNKVYPWVTVVCGWLVQDGVTVILTGGKGPAEINEQALMQFMFQEAIDTTKIAPRAGKWSIRQSIAMAQAAHVVIGPETGVLNAVALDDVPKVIYLSHSSEQNLTKHWKNTTTLAADPKDCPCYPCHMIHKDWSTCVEVEETKAALCASSITPEAVYDAIRQYLPAKRAAAE